MAKETFALLLLLVKHNDTLKITSGVIVNKKDNASRQTAAAFALYKLKKSSANANVCTKLFMPTENL